MPLGRARNQSTSDTNNDYDQTVRELAFDKRSKPKDRTKTEEELALEAKEALEKAERARLRRMMGQDPESDDEGDDRKRRRGGDDLDDDFDDSGQDFSALLGAGLGESGLNGESEGDEGNDDEDMSDDDRESGDEDEVSSGSEPDDISEAESGDVSELVASQRRQAKGKGKAKELPFTFPCPDSHEEFLDVVENVKDSQFGTVVQRIRALYHPSLGPDNKFKLQVGCILDWPPRC